MTTRDLARPLFEAGMRDADIARQLGVTKQRVGQLRRRLGVARRPLVPYTRCAECGTVLTSNGVPFRNRGVRRCSACRLRKEATHWVEVACGWCGGTVRKQKSRLAHSASGLYFCNRSHRSQWLVAQGICLRRGQRWPKSGKRATA